MGDRTLPKSKIKIHHHKVFFFQLFDKAKNFRTQKNLVTEKSCQLCLDALHNDVSVSLLILTAREFR